MSGARKYATRAKPTRVWACVETFPPEHETQDCMLVCVQEFAGDNIAADISAWLGVQDISNVYACIKGKRKVAYRHPQTKRKLVWLDPDNRPDLVSEDAHWEGVTVFERFGVEPPSNGVVWLREPSPTCVKYDFSEVKNVFDLLVEEKQHREAVQQEAAAQNMQPLTMTALADSVAKITGGRAQVVSESDTLDAITYAFKRYDTVDGKLVDAQQPPLVSEDIETFRAKLAQRLQHGTQRKQGSASGASITRTPTRQLLVRDDGDFTMVVFSDSHVVPNAEPSLARLGLIEVLKQLQPEYVVCLGDTFDFASLSRHPRARWEKRHTVAEELAAGKALLQEVIDVAPDATRIYTASNHDDRFSNKLAAQAGEFEGVHGFDLADHIGDAWHHCISVLLNDAVLLKHQWHTGIHAAYQNVQKAGVSVVTGHTHKLEVRALSDYTGVRFGVQTGSLAQFDSEMFNYTEHAPVDWLSGFVVLTFSEGRLLPPETAACLYGGVYFRGERVV